MAERSRRLEEIQNPHLLTDLLWRFMCIHPNGGLTPYALHQPLHPNTLVALDILNSLKTIQRETGWDKEIYPRRWMMGDHIYTVSTIALPRIDMTESGDLIQPSKGADCATLFRTSSGKEIRAVILNADGVTDPQHPDSDREIKRLLVEQLPLVTRTTPIDSLILPALHEKLVESTSGEGKATGCLVEIDYPNCRVSQWGDTGFAILGTTQEAPEKIIFIDQHTQTSPYETATVFLSHLLRRSYLPDELRQRAEKLLQRYLKNSYGEKYNTGYGTDGIGVIGHDGKFMDHVVTKKHNLRELKEWAVITWTDGLGVMADMLGVHPYSLALILEQLLGESREVTLDFITGFAGLQLKQGNWPAHIEARRKFDDLSWTVTQSRHFPPLNLRGNSSPCDQKTPDAARDVELAILNMLTQNS